MAHKTAANASAAGSSKVERGPRRRENPPPSLGNTGSAPPAPGPKQSRTRFAEAAVAEPQKKLVDSDKPVRAKSLLKAHADPDLGKPKAASRRRPVGQEYGTRAYYLRRLGALETERATWVQHWRELAEYLAPRRQRIFWTDRNKGVKRNEKIINSTGCVALRTLGSGMHSGLTSPARPWYRFTTPDPVLYEIPEVRSWLHLVEERMRMVHARSNIYNVLPQAYLDLGAFGTSCLWIEEDPKEVLRGFVFPIGSYALGAGANQMVDSVYRRVQMPVAGVVDNFGYENCSPRTRDLYERGHLDTWILLAQACEPNRDHDAGNPTSKAWCSVWFELDEGNLSSKDFLKKSGYNTFPACAPRWNVNGEDIYGYSPGMDALGDVRALQQLERRKLMTVDKIVNPPFIAPAALRNQRISLLPGDVSYTDASTPSNARFEPAMTIPFGALEAEERSIALHERRVKDTFFATLWMMLSEDDRAQRATAEEIRAKQDEKMLQLGPVLERLHDELLDPLIDRTFEIMLNRGMIPPPPEALQRAAENGNDELRVEYISILAQAQKLVGTAAIDRQVAFVGNLAQLRPEALDLLDVDKLARSYQQMLGTDPELFLAEDVVAQIRQGRAAAQQAQAQQEQMAMQAQTAAQAGNAARSLAAAPLNDPAGPTALNGLLNALGPAAGASGGL